MKRTSPSLQPLLRLFGIALLGVTMQACDSDTTKASGTLTFEGTTVSYNIPADQNASGACDPGNGLGISGVLQWSNDPRWNSGRDWDDSGCHRGDPQLAVSDNASLYFSNLNLSTSLSQSVGKFQRQFGSSDKDGDQDSDRDSRNDWNPSDLSLHLQTQISLGTSDSAGSYQFALIASGSARLQMDRGDGRGLVPVVDNTGRDGGWGWNPTRMMCSQSPVSMTSGAARACYLGCHCGIRRSSDVDPPLEESSG